MREVSIARLIVGKRHCRVLTVGNINSDATGFETISTKIKPAGAGFKLKLIVND